MAPATGRGRDRIDGADGRWLITGTGRGMGAELARLVEDQVGADVIGVDRADPPPDRPRRRVHADLATIDGARSVVDLIADERPSVLVNCAATDQSRPVAATDDHLVDELVQVGLRTPYVLMREMARQATDPDRPVWVVNVVSPYRLVGVRTHSLYCATKAALSRAGESLAVESRGTGLRVVSVVPGAFNSGFRPVEEHDAWLVRTYRNRGARTPAAVARELLRRLGRPTWRRHRTIRLGWDGVAFEAVTRVLAGDLFLDGLDRLIGQRAPTGEG